MSANPVRDAQVRIALETLCQIERAVWQAHVPFDVSGMEQRQLSEALRIHHLDNRVDNAVQIYCAFQVAP